MRSRWSPILGLTRAASVALVLGCGGPASPRDSGSPPDAPLAVDAPPFVPAEPAPPRAPLLLPCPEGWAEVAAAGETPAYCEPFAAGAHLPCPLGEAHFPGEPGCRPVGATCDASGWPASLPATGPVLHVAPGALAGDGTRALPFGTLAEAQAAAPAGAVIALARGAHAEGPPITADLELRGACALETLLERTRTSAAVVSARGGATVVVRDLSIAAGWASAAVWAREGAAVRLEGVAATGAGILSSGSEIVARELSLGTTMDPTAPAVAITGAGSLDAERLSIAGAAGAGLMITGAAALRVSDAVVSDAGAEGIVVSGAGSPVLERVVVLRARAAGMVLDVAGTDLRDVVVRETLPDLGLGEGGHGVVAVGRSSGTLRRVRLDASRDVGVVAAGGATVLSLEDVIVRDVAPSGDGLRGRGLEVGEGAVVRLSGLHVERAADLGVFAHDPGTRVEGADVRVLDTAAAGSSFFGRALQVQTEALVELERVQIARAHEAAIMAASASTRVRLTDLRVEDTLERPCASSFCAGAAAGVGLCTRLDGNVTALRFVVARSALAGVQLAGGGTMDLSEGTIADNPVGANVQTAPFDLARITEHVVYRDNGVNLDTTALPIPDSTAPAAR